MVETMLFRAPGDCAILVQISSAPCRERVYPFRLLVAFWRFSYTFIAASRPETADETTTSGTDKSVPYKGAAKNLAVH